MDDKEYLCALRTAGSNFIYIMLLHRHKMLQICIRVPPKNLWLRDIEKKLLMQSNSELEKAKTTSRNVEVCFPPLTYFVSPLTSLYILQKVGSSSKQVYLVYCYKFYF